MDIETLEAFVAVCDSGSISRAARRVHRSQGAVSRRIARLETLLETTLFDRVPTGVTLTVAGQAFRPHAETALAALADARQAVTAVDTTVSGPVELAVVGTLADDRFSTALRAFATEHPGVDVRLRTANSREVIELVRRGVATVGVGYLAADEPTLASEELFADQLVVAAEHGHPRAEQRLRALRSLRAERWLAFPVAEGRSESAARSILALLTAAGVRPESIDFVDSLTAQKRLIEAGFGLGLVEHTSIRAELKAGTMTVIDVRERLPTVPMYLTVRASGYRSFAAQSMLKTLRHGDIWA